MASPTLQIADPIAMLLPSYRRMFLIRIAEEDLVTLYKKNKIMSFVHFYIGQEAVAVGVNDALHAEDKFLGNHRSHGHYLAKGGNLKKMICELLGKAPGSSRGKGGSMHMIDKSVNFVGSTPILGSVVPLACGTAFALKYRQSNQIAVGFFGDGAFEEGVVYETLNLAALFKLPLLLVVENNLLSVNTRIWERRSPEHDPEKIVTGFGLRYEKANGNDYFDVKQKAAQLAQSARQGQPGLLECVAYRHMAHSAPIFEEESRGEDTADNRRNKDSVMNMRRHLLLSGVSENEIQAIEGEVRREVAEAIAFALNAPYPRKETLYDDLFAH